MIEGYDNYQLELFNGAKGSIPKRPLGSRFFNFLHRHEKKFLVIIGIAVSCIISFSLGVKKGRELAVARSTASFDLAAVPNQAQEKPELSQQEKPLTIKNNIAQGYTVQLASYKTKKFADLEAKTLKEKGLMPFVLCKGNYVILCVGKFSDKEEARNSMSKLKNRYKDCYLRRL